MKDLGIRIREADIDTGVRAQARSEGATLGDLLSAARRQYFPVLLCGFIGIVLGAVHFATSPPKYFAQARVLVDDRMSELAAESTAITPLARNDTALLNEIEILNSQQLAVVVTGNTQLHRNPGFLNPPLSMFGKMQFAVKDWIKVLMLGFIPATEPEPVLLSREQQEARQILTTALFLQRDIKIARVGNSFSVDISILAHDPQVAAGLVNAYAEAYLDDRLNANLQASNRTAEWMRSRLDELLANANAASRDAEEFRANNKVSDLQGLRELEQRADTLNALHNAIAGRYEQISIEGSFPVSNGRVLTTALASKNAATPRLWQYLSIAGLLGVIIGFTIAVSREFRERYFRTGEDVERYTALAFLGYLPKFSPNPSYAPEQALSGRIMEFSSSRQGFHQGQQGPDYGADAGVDTGADNHLDNHSDNHSDTGQQPPMQTLIQYAPHLFIPVIEPNSVFSNTLRNLHASFEQTHSGKTGAVVAVTAMLPGEGGSTVAANYANMVAKLGGRTLLIDAVMEIPSVSSELQLGNQPGLIGVLDGSSQLTDAIYNLPGSGLEFLPNGYDTQQLHTNMALFQQSMPKLIAALRTHYSHVILDLPALGVSADAKILLPGVDKIILTSEWGVTPRNLVQQYMAREPEIARKVLGVVLNRVNLKKLAKYGKFGGSEGYLKR